MRTSTRFIVIALILGLPFPSYAAEGAVPCRHYGGHVSVEGRAGSERSIAETAVFMPVGCSEDRLLFTDVRYKTDDQNNHEGNVALGIRALRETGIAGGYAYFDRRRSGATDKLHSQITIGGEWLAERWEARTNAYVPVTGDKFAAAGTPAGTALSNPFLSGSGIFVNRAGSTVFRETPLYGADAEIGFAISGADVWLHMAAYRFDAEDAKSMTGGRVRASWEITDNVTLFAEGQDDTVRERQGWIGTRLTLPFGGPAHKPEGLKARMTAAPVRDIDIVTTGAVEQLTPDRAVPVLNTETGDPQRVLYVDNTAAGSGDGSLENPFNTLAAAEAALQDYDTLYIARGDGTTAGMNAGLTVNEKNIHVIGEGSAFVYDGQRFTVNVNDNLSGSILRDAGLAPVLTNTGGNGVTVTGDETYLTGFTVNAATGNGIFANSAAGTALSSIEVDNVTVSGNGTTGLRFETNGAGSAWRNIVASNVSATGNAVYGVLAYSRDNARIEDVNLSNITASNNTNRGVYIAADTNGDIDDVAVSNVTANGNTGANGIGVQVLSTGAGSTINTVVANNMTTNGNALYGTFISVQNTGRITSADLSNITASNNGNRGLFVQADSGGDIDYAAVSNVTANGNTGANGIGIQVFSTGAGSTINTLEASDIVTTNNGSYGFIAGVGSSGWLGSAELSGITTSNNANRGAFVIADTNGDIGSVNISNVTANGNTGASGIGMHILATSAGSTINAVTANDIATSGNALYGTFISAQNAGHIISADLSNITTSNNSNRGLLVYAETGGDIDDIDLTEITTNGNTGASGIGTQIFATGAGSTIGNITASDLTVMNNASHGFFVTGQNSGQIGSVSLSDLTASGNANVGTFFLAATAGQINSVDMSDSLSSGNISRGLYVQSLSDGDINAVTLSNITLNDNTGVNGYGAYVYATGAGSTISNLSGSDIEATGNDASGLYVLADTGGSVSAEFQSSSFFNNDVHGVFVDDDTAGAFTVDLGGGALGSPGGNSIYGNIGTEIRVDLDGGELKAENNWWGVNTGLAGGEVTLDAASTIDASPFLVSAP